MVVLITGGAGRRAYLVGEQVEHGIMQYDTAKCKQQRKATSCQMQNTDVWGLSRKSGVSSQLFTTSNGW